ncbi:MAG: flagellar hook assembly protein FlgD [Burkholderiaceae bacterium]|jgi:flagellar basal-body rod modification protein FlgD|nr:flagellar hook assembly protein FlgD [Burkholderiaceae bacterium]
MAVNEVGDSVLSAMNTRNTNAAVAGSVEQTQDQFLKLLLAQMQNQDPLNPMDNAEITSQMAQLSTVTGITQLNETLNVLMSSLSANQSLEAAAMIGHGVLVPGNSLVLSKAEDTVNEAGETVTGPSLAIMGVELSGSASSVNVNIYNENGALVRTVALGAQDAGVIPVSWDGSMDDGTTAPAGRYTFAVEAANGNQAVGATALSFGEVASVTKGSDNNVLLNVLTIGSVKLSDIRQIL